MARFIRSVLVVCALAGVTSQAICKCPSADLTGDCRVDMADMAVLVGQWLTDGSAPEYMVRIPGGTFQMGDSLPDNGNSDRLPVHTVVVSAFRISRYVITNKQYCEFLNAAMEEGSIVVNERGEVQRAGLYDVFYCATGNSWDASAILISDGVFTVGNKGVRPMGNDPVVAVTWYGAAAYCNWLSEQQDRQPCYAGDDPLEWECDFTANGYYLPTEAQWEYAARGGVAGKRFPWGDTIDHSRANYAANGSLFTYDTSPYTMSTYHPAWADGIIPYTSPVGTFPANGYGLYEMSGNVWEWCNDWYGSYSSAPQTDPTGSIIGTARVQRGGSWLNIASSCTVAYRGYKLPGSSGYASFRVCLEP